MNLTQKVQILKPQFIDKVQFSSSLDAANTHFSPLFTFARYIADIMTRRLSESWYSMVSKHQISLFWNS
jgi:hypothetical protein